MLAHTLSVHTLYYLQTVTVSTTYFPPALKSLQAHKTGEERAVQKDDKSKKTNKTVQRKWVQQMKQKWETKGRELIRERQHRLEDLLLLGVLKAGLPRFMTLQLCCSWRGEISLLPHNTACICCHSCLNEPSQPHCCSLTLSDVNVFERVMEYICHPLDSHNLHWKSPEISTEGEKAVR